MIQLLRYIVVLMMVVQTPACWALDSYRFLHVSIETPWLIFLVLLPIVLSPFILMAILYWRFAGRNPEQQAGKDQEGGRE